jgi:hypothetical protein
MIPALVEQLIFIFYLSFSFLSLSRNHHQLNHFYYIITYYYHLYYLKKARYVNNLLTTAKMREKEKERVYEKQLLKERQIEDQEFGDKPKYMTAAYKKKLIEDKKWEYEDKLADEIEKNTDIRKSGMEGIFLIITFVNLFDCYY